MRRLQRGLVLAALTASSLSFAADPIRGERLYREPPGPGLLGCADCHSEAPQVLNFGNIWVGRNAPGLIQRAIASNTGGMGYLSATIGAQEAADIAAWLGNAPSSLMFPLTPLGTRSTAQRVTISTSTKTDLPGLRLQAVGEFEIVASDCPANVGRFASCTVDVAFVPQAAGERAGALVLSHPGTPTPVQLPLSGMARPRPAAIAAVEPATLSFTAGAAREAGPPRRLVLSNRSTEPLTVTGLELSGTGVTIVGGDCPAGRVLAPGQSCTLGLRWTPSGAGASPSAGHLDIAHDGLNSPARVAWSARIEDNGPALRANRAGIDFGPRTPGQASDPAWVVLRHAGPDPLQMAGIDVVGTAFRRASAVATPGGEPLCAVGQAWPAGQPCAVAVQATAPRDGPFSGVLEVRVAGRNAPWLLPLAVQGRGHLLLTRPALVAAEAGVPVSMRVVHHGTVPVTLGAATIEGNPAAWSVAPGGCAPGTVLLPAEGCTMSVVRASAAAASAEAATLVLRASGAPGVGVEHRVRLVPVAPEVAPWAHEGPLTEWTALANGSVQAPATATVRVLIPPQERGRADLVLQGSPRFSAALACPSLAANPCSIQARLDPGQASAPGVLEAQWTLRDGQERPRARGVLRAVVLASAPWAPGMNAGAETPWAGQGATGTRAVAQLDFGDQEAPVSEPFSLTLTGSGPAPGAARWQIVGDRAAFSLEREGSSCLQEATTRPCTLRVRFHADAPGLRHAALGHVDAALSPLPLLGRGMSHPAATPQASADGALAFDAEAGPSAWRALTFDASGHPEAQLGAVSLEGTGYRREPLQGVDCPGEDAPWWPGDRCTLPLRWDGTAAALAGGTVRWQAQSLGTTHAESRALTLREAPAPASVGNVGAGGGAAGPLATLGLLVASLLLAGCSWAPPRPWQKDLLARDEMRLDGDPLEQRFQQHIYSSKENSSGGAGVGGGGCGCN